MKIEHKKTTRKRRIALIEMRRTSYKDHKKKKEVTKISKEFKIYSQNIFSRKTTTST